MTVASPLSPSSRRSAPAARRRLRDLPAPPAPISTVARARLVQRLRDAGPARVLVLTAPAGYGKTTLLRAWAAQDDRPACWIGAGGEAARELLACAEAPPWGPRPLLLIVDGDRVGRGPAVRDALARLAAGVPAGSVLAISTRGATPRPVARLRTEHQVLELGVRDLAMTHGEAAGVLRAWGVRLGAAATDALVDRLEGWPVALALAGLSLAGAEDPEAAAAAFGGHDRLVGDYVHDELLAALPDRSVRMLERCSVAERLEPSLCDALAGGEGAWAALTELEQAGLPLAATEREGLRVRCHPLLREVLLADLRRGDAALARTLHARAAAWFEERGDTDRAVEQLLAAGDVERAASLIWTAGAAYVWDARAAQLQAWLARIPVRRVEAGAALAATLAADELARGRFAHAAHWAGFAQRGLAGVDADTARSLQGGVDVLQALAAPDDLGGLRRGAAAAALVMPPADPWRPLCCLTEGAGALLAGDDERATARLEEGVRGGMVDAAGVAALCEAELALAALCDGDWAQGACLAERARGRIEQTHLDDHPTLALVIAVGAFARAHRGRFAEARADLALTDRLTAAVESPPAWWLAQLHVGRARAALRLSDVSGGREALELAARPAARLPEAAALQRWIEDGRRFADAAAAAGLPGFESLTAAELRILRFLPSHRSFREIGAELFVSQNTVKTQAHAVYRKLGATSRSGAVQRAVQLGLLEPDGAGSSRPGDVAQPAPA